MIHILVDSAADFSKKEIEEKGIHLVSLQVSFQEEQYLDGVNLEETSFMKNLYTERHFRRLHSHPHRNSWMCLKR